MKEFIESKPYKKIIGEVLTPKESLEYNGHTCPKCNSELFDDKSIQYMSNPPQYKTVCTKCGYKGMRYI